MAITKLTLASAEDLVSFFQEYAVPTYFKAVTYASSAITCTNDDDEPILIMDDSADPYKIRLYISSSKYNDTTMDTKFFDDASLSSTIIAYVTDGGILLYRAFKPGSYWYVWSMIITKNNNGVTMIIEDGAKAQGSGDDKQTVRNQVLRNNIRRIAYNEDDTARSGYNFAYTQHAGNFSQLVPFASYAKADRVSFAPRAYYMPFGQFGSTEHGTISYNGKYYAMNGFWAVEDREFDED